MQKEGILLAHRNNFIITPHSVQQEGAWRENKISIEGLSQSWLKSIRASI